METTKEVQSSSKRKRVEFETFYSDFPVAEDTTCGYSVLKGSFLQYLATKNSYIVVNGLAGCLITACFTYFSGSISTMEKLFGIHSQRSGILSVGNDISQVLVTVFIAYYLGNKHRPRWMAIGLLCFSLYCFICALPHFIYGSGKDLLLLTLEHHDGHQGNDSTTAFIEREQRKSMCQLEETSISDVECSKSQNVMPQVIIFTAQIIAGVGNAIYSSLNAAYMDDNVQRSKAPWVISVTQFVKMFGPALGYTLAALCLNIFIDPSRTPRITSQDPRWIGAWWIGMLVLGVISTILALLVSLFPKRLPRYVAKEAFYSNGNNSLTIAVDASIEKNVIVMDEFAEETEDQIASMSMADLGATAMRILKNKIFMFNLTGLILYFFGVFPYWIFLAKYIEVQYRKSASEANLYTGVVGLVFSGIGVLASGIVLSKFKPSARKIVLWNVLTTIITGLVFLTYNWIGCDASDRATAMTTSQMLELNTSDSCSSLCNCEFVKYSPVCGENGISYISPCHAGCSDVLISDDDRGGIRYSNCSCVMDLDGERGGWATTGACKVDCSQPFYIFLAFKCLNNFLSSSGIAGTILIGVRSVLRKDKTFAMGLKFALTSLLAFVPAPIMFGSIIDKTCIFWGKTACGELSNCWIYDGQLFRFNMNTISCCLLLISSLFNLFVWCCVKDLSIFDEDQSKMVYKSVDTKEDHKD